MNYEESFASAWHISLEYDLTGVWFLNGNAFDSVTALGAILGNLQYNRQACVQSLISHHVSTGLYWRYFNDDEITFVLGALLEPASIIGGANWTNAVVSGGSITFNVSNPQVPSVWSQSTGAGTWIRIVDAANSCLNRWYPILTASSTAWTSTSTCSNGTYAPAGGTIAEPTAQMVINPSYLPPNQNISALPGNLTNNSFQQTWDSNLTQMTVSGGTLELYWAGHSLSSGQAIRIWNASSGNLNTVAPVTVIDANHVSIAYSGSAGQAAPTGGPFNSSTDPMLYVTVDPNWGPNPLAQFYSLVNGVSNHPVKSWSILGSFYTTGSAQTVYSYEGNPANTDSSWLYIPIGPPSIYGSDTSVWSIMNYSQPYSGLATRAYQLKPRAMLWSAGIIDGNAIIQYCRSSTFNPGCDHPAGLNLAARDLGDATDGDENSGCSGTARIQLPFRHQRRICKNLLRLAERRNRRRHRIDAGYQPEAVVGNGLHQCAADFARRYRTPAGGQQAVPGALLSNRRSHQRHLWQRTANSVRLRESLRRPDDSAANHQRGLGAEVYSHRIFAERDTAQREPNQRRG